MVNQELEVGCSIVLIRSGDDSKVLFNSNTVFWFMQFFFKENDKGRTSPSSLASLV